MTVDSSYNLVTGHPMSFWGSQLLKNSHSLTSFVSLGSTGAWPLYCAATVSCSTNMEFHVCTCTSNFGHTTIDPPPDNHLAIPLGSTALVPRGAMCTPGMAMWGSGLLCCWWATSCNPKVALTSNAH